MIPCPRMLIFVYGENAFLARGHVREMRKRFFEKFDAAGLNHVEFFAPFVLGEVVQAIGSPPFLAQKRMVVVYGLLSFATKKADYAPWAKALSNIPDSTIVVLVDDVGVGKTEKHGLFKQLQSAQEVHRYRFPVFTPSQLAAWARQYASQCGLNTSTALLEKTLALIGNDPWLVALELDKLAARLQDQPLTEAVMREMIHAHFEERMFDFIDALTIGRSRDALALLQEQRLAGATDMYLFAMLARQTRLLLAAADMLARDPRATKQEFAQALAVHPFVAQKTLLQAKQFSLDALRAVHRQLFALDEQMKRGAVDMRTAVDLLVVQFLQRETVST